MYKYNIRVKALTVYSLSLTIDIFYLLTYRISMSKIVKKVTSVVALSAIAFSIVGSASGVNAAYTGLDAANKLATMGVIVDQSTNPSNYRLGDTITRRELAKVVAKLGKITVSESCEGKFADLKSTDWGCKYAEALLAAGYISANTNFRPIDEVSKSEALKMVMKARGIEKSSNSNWQAAYVEWAVAAGIAEAFSDYNVSWTRWVIFTWAVNEESSDDDLLEDLIGDLDDTSTETTDDDTSTETTDDTTTNDTSSTTNTLTVSLSPETPMDGLTPVNTPRTSLLAFDVKAWESDATLSTLTLEFVGLGNYADLNEVAVYNSKGEKVSKSKDFSAVTREISFNRDVIVKAGETETFTVSGKIWDDSNAADLSKNNATYGVKLIDLKASWDVEGGELLWALLVPFSPTNIWELRITANEASWNITIGKDAKLAWFELKENSDDEAVVVKSINFHLEGGVSWDSFSNLALYADGKEIAADLSFNSSDDLVAAVNYEIPAKWSVSFELRWVVTADVNEKFTISFDDSDDVYAVGKKTGYSVKFTWSTTVTWARIAQIDRLVEGSEISVSFAKWTKDEARPDASDVKVGTLKMLAASEWYTVKKVEVRVQSTWTGVTNVIDSLELNGSTEDNLYVYNSNWYANPTTATNTNTDVAYIYKDIDLTKWLEKVLDLTMDVKDAQALNNAKLTFTVKILEVKDEDNNKTYTLTSTPKVDSVLSTNSFNPHNITVKTANFTLTKVAQNPETIVLWSQELVAYRAKVSVWDADSVKVKKFVLKNLNYNVSNGAAYSGSLDDIIDSATLKIGNVEIGEDNIDSDSIDFNNVNTVIEAGQKNVPLTVVVKFKSNDKVTSEQTLALVLNSSANTDIVVNDSDNNEFVPSVTSTGSTLTLTMRDHGKLSIAYDTSEDKTALTDVNKVVLAGRTGVQLAKLKLDSKYEESRVKNMVFRLVWWNFSDTVTNVKLVSVDGKVLASGADVTVDWTDTKIEFKEDFNLPVSETKAYLVADINPISDAGTAVKSTTWKFQVQLDTTSSALIVDWYVSWDNYTPADLTLPSSFTAKEVTIAANSVAWVTLTAAKNNITAESGAVIAKITIDTENQSFNKYNDGKDIIEALLKTIKLDISASNVTVSNIKLSRSGTWVSLVSWTTKTVSVSDFSSTGAFLNFATIDDGKATFDVIADLAAVAGGDITKATLNVKVANVEEIKLDDGSLVDYDANGVKTYAVGTEISKVFSSKTATADKQLSVDIKN